MSALATLPVRQPDLLRVYKTMFMFCRLEDCIVLSHADSYLMGFLEFLTIFDCVSCWVLTMLPHSPHSLVFSVISFLYHLVSPFRYFSLGFLFFFFFFFFHEFFSDFQILCFKLVFIVLQFLKVHHYLF